MAQNRRSLIIIVHLICCIKYGNLTLGAPIISHKELLLDSVRQFVSLADCGAQSCVFFLQRDISMSAHIRICVLFNCSIMTNFVRRTWSKTLCLHN